MEQNSQGYMDRAHHIITENLRQKRMLEETHMAQLALNLQSLDSRIEEAEQKEIDLLPISLSATIIHWSDHHYFGNFVPKFQPITIEVDCGDLPLAYLLAVSRLPIDLIDYRGEKLHPSLGTASQHERDFDEYTSIRLSKVITDEVWEEPNNEMMTLWDEAAEKGHRVLSQLFDEVVATDPYKNISTRIKRSDLYDTILRQRIESLCSESDDIREHEAAPEEGR